MAVVRVSGNAGSGKTTLCKRLAAVLNYGHLYAGGMFRKMAVARGMSIEAFYAQLKEDPELEKSVDTHMELEMCARDCLVAEGRIAPFLRCNFRTVNVKVAVSPEEGARRQLLRPENSGKPLEEMLMLSSLRTGQERVRYRVLYGIEDYLDDRHFDIVLDTTYTSADAAFSLLCTLLLPRLLPSP